MTSLTFKTQNSTYCIQKECNNYKTTAADLLEKRHRYRIPKYDFMPTHDKLTMRIHSFLEYVASSDEILAKTVGGDMESAVSLLNEW